MKIPKRRKRPKMGVREEPWYRSQTYRQWVAGHECAIKGRNGHECVNHVVAAHVRTGTDGATAEKPSDWWCIPLCDDMRGGGAHGLQHRIGEAAFEAKFKLNMKQYAIMLWARNLVQRRKHEEQWTDRSPVPFGPQTWRGR